MMMEAGRELDALVAERVFGEAKPAHPGDQWWSGRSQPLHSSQGQWYMSVKVGDWVPRPYSTDIGLAWQVVEKLRGRGVSTRLEVMSHADFVGVEMGYPSHEVRRTETSAAHAICLVAIQIVADFQAGV